MKSTKYSDDSLYYGYCKKCKLIIETNIEPQKSCPDCACSDSSVYCLADRCRAPGDRSSVERCRPVESGRCMPVRSGRPSWVGLSCSSSDDFTSPCTLGTTCSSTGDTLSSACTLGTTCSSTGDTLSSTCTVSSSCEDVPSPHLLPAEPARTPVTDCFADYLVEDKLESLSFSSGGSCGYWPPSVVECPECQRRVGMTPASTQPAKVLALQTRLVKLEAQLDKANSVIEAFEKRLMTLEFTPPISGGPEFHKLMTEAKAAGDF